MRTIRGNNRVMRLNNCRVVGSGNEVHGDFNFVQGDDNKAIGNYNVMAGVNNRAGGTGNTIHAAVKRLFGTQSVQGPRKKIEKKRLCSRTELELLVTAIHKLPKGDKQVLEVVDRFLTLSPLDTKDEPVAEDSVAVLRKHKRTDFRKQSWERLRSTSK